MHMDYKFDRFTNLIVVFCICISHCIILCEMWSLYTGLKELRLKKEEGKAV